MSWIGGPKNTPWQRHDVAWGLGFADVGAPLLHRGRWSRPLELMQPAPDHVVVKYEVGGLRVAIERRIVGQTLQERYAFTNIGSAGLTLGGRDARLGIYTPFNDHYTNTTDVLEHRCHAHVWTGGASSWVALLRMGGRAPHLGLVLTEGALDAYSIEDRDTVTASNTRGTFLLHPLITRLEPGQTRSLAWTLFWHRGWDDFFRQAGRYSKQLVRVDASRWTTLPGETAALRFAGDLGASPTLLLNGREQPLVQEATGWRARLPAIVNKELTAVLRHGDGLESRIALNAAPDLDALIEARVRFITTKQQWRRDGDPWDGAYILYDNDTDTMVRRPPGPPSDRNDGRERLAMGVLVARWLRQGKKADPAVRASLDRYYRFVQEKLQRSDGYVFDGTGHERKRLYNWAWVLQMHLEMGALTGLAGPLDAFMNTLESYYREGGAQFYAIGLPVAQSLRVLKAARRTADHERALTLFREHGRTMAERGVHYPSSEVNFEQAIVAPAAILLLELHEATGEAKWLQSARPHLALLDQFEGRQPDHRLHGVSIRHWDGYWFGKSLMWGDTFPHYWSSLNALAWAGFANATGNDAWHERARTTLRANLSLFTAEGRGHAAFIYPRTVNGRAAHFADAYANDQDWALVHALQLREMTKHAD